MYNDLEDEELKSRFNGLLRTIGLLNINRTEEAEINLTESIRLQVTANPTLSRINRGKSILMAIVLCKHRRFRSRAQCQSIVKFIIQMNPSALVWHTISPVSVIARNKILCVMMPWIAAKYPWVLDHEQGKQSVFDLIDLYNRRNDTSQFTT